MRTANHPDNQHRLALSPCGDSTELLDRVVDGQPTGHIAIFVDFIRDILLKGAPRRRLLCAGDVQRRTVSKGTFVPRHRRHSDQLVALRTEEVTGQTGHRLCLHPSDVLDVRACAAIRDGAELSEVADVLVLRRLRQPVGETKLVESPTHRNEPETQREDVATSSKAAAIEWRIDDNGSTQLARTNLITEKVADRVEQPASKGGADTDDLVVVAFDCHHLFCNLIGDHLPVENL